MGNPTSSIPRTKVRFYSLKNNRLIIYSSVVIDTLPKKSRKEKLEAEMKQLERDIELLERHPVIYIQ